MRAAVCDEKGLLEYQVELSGDMSASKTNMAAMREAFVGFPIAHPTTQKTTLPDYRLNSERD